MQALSAEKEQVGWYKSTNTDEAAGTKAQILTQPALPGQKMSAQRNREEGIWDPG
jgi:hypothetical protein